MSEYITEIANDIAKSCPDLVENGCGNDNCVACLAFKLIGLGNQKQEWISVDERLPENDYGKHWKDRRYYLVMTEPCGLMRVARFGYKDFPWWIDSHDTVLTSANYNKVTHWMPIPEAPKMKGEENG